MTQRNWTLIPENWTQVLAYTFAITAVILCSLYALYMYVSSIHVKEVCAIKVEIAANTIKRRDFAKVCTNSQSFLDCSKRANELYPVDAKDFGFYEYELVKVEPEECGQ